MDGDLLKRLDRHMERGNELFYRGNELMDRVEEEMRLTREQHADHMRETREARRGYRIAINEVLREGRANREVISENRVAMREMREASEAHTKAIWALLDRLENGGASPATG